MLPGTSVTTLQQAPPRSAPTAISPWFVAGATQQGPTTPQTLRSMNDYATIFGGRLSSAILYDALDAYFQEGGNEAIVARVVGPTPVLATVNLLDGSSVTSLIVTAKGYGSYANGWKILVTGSGPYTITVEDSNSNVLEVSPSLTTQADAVNWATNTAQYVNIALGTSALIPVAETNKVLAGGTDDITDATDTNWLNAINLFTKDLGPGQVSMPGRTTSAAHANLIAHAAANNRRALLDFADSGSRATLVTAAGTDTAVTNSEYAAGAGPWVVIPGVVNGTTRTVPSSAITAGIMARNDNAGLTPNQPSAGTQYGVSRIALGLSQSPWSDSDRSLLNSAGVNVFRTINGSIVLFGYRTLAPLTVPADWVLLSNSRLVMAIVAQAQQIGLGYVFKQIDGNGFLFADFAADLKAMLVPYYNDGSLFGDTPADAFSVDTGPSVNTPTTIAALQLNAVISLALSPDAEQVPIEIVTTTLTEGVS